MADERDDEKSSAEDQSKDQTIGGQQSHRSEYGSRGDQTQGASGQPIGGNDSQTGSGTTMGQGSEPPRSMGTRGSEFGQFGDATGGDGQQGQSGTGQADLGTQGDTTLAGRSDQQDFGTDQPGSVGGASGGGSTGEGFIGSQSIGRDDLVRDREGATGASSDKATGGTDFAREGRGALDEEDEDESGAGPRDVGSGGPGSSV